MLRFSTFPFNENGPVRAKDEAVLCSIPKDKEPFDNAEIQFFYADFNPHV